MQDSNLQAISDRQISNLLQYHYGNLANPIGPCDGPLISFPLIGYKGVKQFEKITSQTTLTGFEPVITESKSVALPFGYRAAIFTPRYPVQHFYP